MQPSKLTFNSAPNLSAPNDTARSNISNKRSQIHLPGTEREPCLSRASNLWMRNGGIKMNFFASGWVVEVEPGHAILEKPSAARDAAEPTYFPRTADGRRDPAGAWSNR